jgi:hypothetical protein
LLGTNVAAGLTLLRVRQWRGSDVGDRPEETVVAIEVRPAGGRFAHRWQGRQIDSRSVAMTSKEQIAKWSKDYGEDSDFTRIRVKGQFPRVPPHYGIESRLP